MKRRKEYLGWLLIVPVFVVFGIFAIYPFIATIYMSFHRWKLYVPAVPFIGLDNFRTFFTDPEALGSLRNTLFLTGGAVSLEIVCGLGIALLFMRSIRGRKVYLSTLMVPMIMTPVVVGLLWKMMLNETYGVVNYILAWLRLPIHMSLGDARTALLLITLVDIWQWTPFMVLVFLAGIESLPVEIFEAAKVDGTSNIQMFGYIILPLLVPVILVALLIRSIDVLKMFDKVYVMTGGGPGTASETLPFYGFVVAFRYMHMGYGATIGFILNLMILLFSQIFIRFLAREVSL